MFAFAALFLTQAFAATRTGHFDAAAPENSTTLENSLVNSSNWPAEGPPSGLDEAIVRDAANVVSAGPNGVCVALRLNNSSDVDTGLSGYQIEINNQDVYPDEKTATLEVIDYSYTGTRTLVDLAVLAGAGGGALTIGKPEDRIFRVVSRTFTVCSARPATGKITVSVKIPTAPAQKLRETFVWE